MKRFIFIVLVSSVIGACANNEEVNENEGFESTEVELSAKGTVAKSPFITNDQNGCPVVSWVEGEKDDTYLVYARWDEAANGFRSPVKVEVTKGLAAHHESMPKVAFKEDGTAYVVYQVKESSPTNRFASALYYSFSTDEKTWSVPHYLHSDTSSGIGRSFFDLAVLPNGELGAIWLDGRKRQGNGSTLMFAKTTRDHSFVTDIEIAQKTCQCCRTDIYVDDSETIHVAFRDIIRDSIRDMVHLVSSNNGETFSEPRRISEDNWILDGCPHTGPSMASNSKGLHFYWFTAGGGDGVYTTSTRDGGEHFASRTLINPHARHPQVISAKNEDLVLVWDETFKTDSTYLDRIGFGRGNNPVEYISKETINSDHPVLTELPNGGIVVVWVESNNGKSSIRYRVM